VKQSKLGEVVTYQSHYDRYRPAVRDRWREWDQAGAGLLYDLGSHLIDQAVDLMGRPDSVWADLAHQRSGAQTDDYFHVVLRYGERRAILHGASLVAQPPFRFAVHGARASFIKHGLDTQEASLIAAQRPGARGWGEEPESSHGELITPGNEKELRERIPSLPGAYQTYYAGVARAILEGAPPPVSAIDARNVIAIIQAARESARTGCAIPLIERLR
jgi:scyllo-inositol 2-dehydrogenase (NADP+)